MLLYYIRHGDPIYDPDCLTPLGQKQAEAVAKRLALNGIDEIYSSSSNRAVCTARPTSELVGRPVNILDWCNENYAWQELSVTDDDGSRKWFFHIEKYRSFSCRRMLKLGLDWHSHEQLKDIIIVEKGSLSVPLPRPFGSEAVQLQVQFFGLVCPVIQ